MANRSDPAERVEYVIRARRIKGTIQQVAARLDSIALSLAFVAGCGRLAGR